jgi:hypothetical protein
VVNRGKRNPLLSRLKSGSALVDATTKALYLYAPPVPTVVQYYINNTSPNTSGGDGTTNATSGAGRAFVNWTDARAAIIAAYPNLLASNVQINIDVTGLISLSSSITDCNGFTTDATHYLNFRAASGQAHAGYYDATKAGFLTTVNTTVFSGSLQNYTRFDRLQFVNALNSLLYGTGFSLSSTTDSGGYQITNCVFHRYGRSAGNVQGGTAFSWSGTQRREFTIANCVFSGSWFYGVENNYAQTGSSIFIYNNTFIGISGDTASIGYGISMTGQIDPNTTFIKNNRVEVSGAFASCYNLVSGAITATNFSSDTTSPNTAGRSKTGTFVDAAAFNYALTSGDAGVGAGTPTVYDVTYLLTTDIIGTARPQQTTWDVGAFEYIVSGGIVYTQSLAASLTGAGVLSPRTLRSHAASLTAAAAVLRSALHPVSASLSASTTVARSAGKAVAGSVTATTTVVRTAGTALAASLTATTTVSTLKVALRSVAASLTASSTVTRRAIPIEAASLTATSTVTRVLALVRTVSGSLTATAAVALRRPLAVAASLTATAVVSTLKVFTRALAASLTATATVARLARPLVSAALTPSSTVTRGLALARTLSASLTASSTLSRGLSRAVAGSVTATGAVSTLRVFLRAVTASLTATTTVGRRVTKAVSRTIASAGTVTKRSARTATASLASAGVATRQRFSSPAGSVTATATVSRRAGRALAAALPVAATLVRLVGRTITAAIALVRQLTRYASGATMPVRFVDRSVRRVAVADATTGRVAMTDATTPRITVDDTPFLP